MSYVWFSFMNIIREELHRFAIQWNLHKMRPSSNENSPCGRSDLLHTVLELNGTGYFMIPVSLDDLGMAKHGID